MQRNPKYSFFQIVILKSRFSMKIHPKSSFLNRNNHFQYSHGPFRKIFGGFRDGPEFFESFDDGFEVYFGFGLFERILYYPIINQVWLISILIRHLKVEFWPNHFLLKNLTSKYSFALSIFHFQSPSKIGIFVSKMRLEFLKIWIKIQILKKWIMDSILTVKNWIERVAIKDPTLSGYKKVYYFTLIYSLKWNFWQFWSKIEISKTMNHRLNNPESGLYNQIDTVLL